MADDRFIILHSKRLLDVQSHVESNSDLDLPIDDEYYPYGIGYLRLLSDLSKSGYKLVILSEHQAGKETTEFERLFEHCDGLGIQRPIIHSKIFYATMQKKRTRFTKKSKKELVPPSLLEYKKTVQGRFKTYFSHYYTKSKNNMRDTVEQALGLQSSDRSQCFLFCDTDFPAKEFDGYKKFTPNDNGDPKIEWTDEVFFNTLSRLYFETIPSPEFVFDRLVKYSEYFVDNSRDIYFPDDFPLENLTPNDVLEKIDQASSQFNTITQEQWAQLKKIKKWISYDDEVFLSSKITSIEVSKLNEHEPRNKSAYGNLRPVRDSFDEKANDLAELLEDFMPGYVENLDELLITLERSSENLRSKGYKEPSDILDDLHDNIEAQRYWLENYYGNDENSPFVQLYGLMSCVENSLEHIKGFMDEESEDYQDFSDMKLCPLDVVKNIGFFLLASLTIIPLIVHTVKYNLQIKEDKRVTFAFFTPQNELTKLHLAAEKIVEAPARGIYTR